MSAMYIVVAPSFDDSSGGAIALHYLCHCLNDLGEAAYLFPDRLLPSLGLDIHRGVAGPLEYAVRRAAFPLFKYRTKLGWKTPILKSTVDSTSIVIYPEVVEGNPLGAKSVVRWFLYSPGFHTGSAKFGGNELEVYFQRVFAQDAMPGGLGDDDILRLVWNRSDVYTKTNFGQRAGSCYMMRKGRGRKIAHNLGDSIQVDGMGHEELAQTFNLRKYFISYDPYTLYSRFAAMCGCISVVVPLDGVSREEWQPEVEMRLGVAYGFEDIEWAISTQSELLKHIEKEERLQLQQLRRFVSRTKEVFPR